MFCFAGTDDNYFSSLSTKFSSPTSSPAPSPMPANEISQTNLDQVQFVPFSPSAIKAMNFKEGKTGSISKLESGSCDTNIATSKFKLNANTEVVVPRSDTSLKRKNAMDGFLGETTKVMEKIASTVETVMSRNTKKIPSQDSALSSLSVTIADVMQDVPKAKRRMCLIKVLEVIEQYTE